MEASNGARVSAATIAQRFDALLSQISDFWFGMAMLAVWGVFTLIGVIVDQGKDPAYYFSNYAPPLARLVLRLHLDNIYHSAGYIAVVGFIVACMTLATFRRVIPARLPPLRAVRIERIPLNASVVVAGDERSVRERVAQFFNSRGWLVRKREFGGVEWTFADKHDWARRGVLVAHIGFVLIAAGTTAYWKWGFNGQTAMLPGVAQIIPETGARFVLDRFNYQIDPVRTKSGTIYQPIDYVSQLQVTARDGITRPMTLRVNHPIDVDGTLYYQASYGTAVTFAVTKDGRPAGGSPNAPLMEGEGFPLGDTGRSVQYGRFVGTIDRSGGVSPDPRPNAPGVILSVFDGDQNIGSVLVPMGGSLELGNGYRVRVGSYALYSGIEYRHDPGVPLVALGAIVLVTGLVMSFYFLPARLYVRVDPSDDSTPEEPHWSVGVAATTVKGYDIFEEQFAALVDDLRMMTRDATEPSSQPPDTEFALS